MVKKKAKYPLRSSKSQFMKALRQANVKLKKFLTKTEIKKLKKIQDDFVKGKDSLAKFTKKRKLILSRKQLHNRIIRKHFKSPKSIDKKDPDLYILGGIAGSGKTEVIGKRLPKKNITIDNDYFKSLLAKVSKSPLKRFKLAHAAFLHEESSMIFKRAMLKALKEKRDLTLDMTFANFAKGKKIMNMFKRAGYDVHLRATQKKPHQSVVNVVSRFIKKGRFVPPGIIVAKGNRINKNVLKARKLADSYVIIDTTIKGKPKIVYKSRKTSRTNFRNPKKKR